MKTRIIIFCCFLLVSCEKKENPQIIYSSVSDVGAIAGKITTVTGDTPVAGAMITTSPAVHTVYSDSAGNYTMPDMPPGNYIVRVSGKGYIPDSTTVSLVDWRTVQVNLTLSTIRTDIK